MVRRTFLIGLCAFAAACQPSGGPRKTGPAVARGSGFTITADEFKARLDEQSPFIRARYSSLERKKEFLDNLIRFEVLAREAERQGLRNDPDMQLTLKRLMVQKLVQKTVQSEASPAEIPPAEVQKYYEDHRDEYNRPKKVRLAAVIFTAAQGSPERAKKAAAARKALQKLRAEEKRNSLVFAQVVSEFSDDLASKATAGDLQFKSKAELEKAYSKQVADSAFTLKPGETSGVLEAPQGLFILKQTGEQPEMVRTFDQAKAQIEVRLRNMKKTKDLDDWYKRLREQARVSIDEKTLDAVQVPPAPTGGSPISVASGPPGGGPMGGPPMGGPMVGSPMGAPPGHPPPPGAPRPPLRVVPSPPPAAAPPPAK